MSKWLKSWWVTLRYGSPFTRAGRELRRTMRDPMSDEFYVEVGDPTAGVSDE